MIDFLKVQYVVVAYRQGKTNKHQYFVACLEDLDDAKFVADSHYLHRARKYGVRVLKQCPCMVSHDLDHLKVMYEKGMDYAEPIKQ